MHGGNLKLRDHMLRSGDKQYSRKTQLYFATDLELVVCVFVCVYVCVCVCVFVCVCVCVCERRNRFIRT